MNKRAVNDIAFKMIRPHCATQVYHDVFYDKVV